MLITKLFNFLNERNDTINIARIIKSMIAEYKENGIDFDMINQGSCMEFAEELHETLKNCGLECEILSDGMFYDPFDDMPKEMLDNPDDYGKTPSNFDEIGLPSHYWVYCNGKHYDSESPNGVTNMFELPTIKRFYKKYTIK